MIAWIIEQLITIIFGFISTLVIILIGLFLGDLSFTKSPDFGGPLNKYITYIFGDNPTTITTAIVGIGFSMLLINAMIQLYRNILEDDRNAPSPIRVLWNSMKYAFFVGAWYKLGAEVLNIFATAWQALIGITFGTGLAGATASGWAQAGTDMLNGFLPAATQGVVHLGLGSFGAGLEAFKAVESLIGCLIALFILIDIFIKLFKQSINLVQRFVIISVLYMFAPLAFGMGNNVKYESMPKSYFSLIVSNTLHLVIMSVFILIGCKCLINLNGLSSVFLGAMTVDAIFIFIGDIDSYLGQLGLRSGGSGRTLGDSVGAATMRAGSFATNTVAGKRAGATLADSMAYAMTDAYNLRGMRSMMETSKFGSLAQSGALIKASRSPYGQDASKPSHDSALRQVDEDGKNKPNFDSDESQRNFEELQDKINSGDYDVKAGYDSSGSAFIETTDEYGNKARYERSTSKDANGNEVVSYSKHASQEAEKAYYSSQVRKAVPVTKGMSDAQLQQQFRDNGVTGHVLGYDGENYVDYNVNADGSFTKTNLDESRMDFSNGRIEYQASAPDGNGTYSVMYDTETFGQTFNAYEAFQGQVPTDAKDVMYDGQSVHYTNSAGQSVHSTIGAREDSQILGADRSKVDVKDIPGSPGNVIVTETGSSKFNSGNKAPEVRAKRTEAKNIGKNSWNTPKNPTNP